MTEVNEVQIRRGGTMADGEGGGRMGKIIKLALGLVLLLLLAGGGYAAYLFLVPDSTTPSAGAPATLREEGGSIRDPHYLQLGEFIVNLADGRRYLKTNLQLLLSEPNAAAYLNLRLAEVRDLIVAELQTLDSEQLRDARNRELLKNRLLTKVESLLPSDKDRDWKDPKPVKKVLMTEFYLQ